MSTVERTRTRQATLIIELALLLVPCGIALTAHIALSRVQNLALPVQQHAQNSPKGTSAGQSKVSADLVVVQAPEVRRGPLSQRFPQGSRLVRLSGAGHTPQNLTSAYFTASDPELSFDGRHVLFAGKKTANSAWQIWEMNADGSGARQVTRCAVDCLKPAYLPRGEIVFTAIAETKTDRTGATSQIWVSKVDGSDDHPITFGPGDFEVETVLKNGTILATARSPLVPGAGAPADRELYTLRPDGTGLASLRCDHQHPAIRSQAQETDDGAVVFVKASLNSRSVGGSLVWIPRGALHNAALTSPLIVASSPQPIAPNKLLVARPSGIGHQGGRLALYAFDPVSGRFTSTIYADSKLSTVQSVPVAAHETPRWYWSTLNPDLHRGYFVCLNAYLALGVPQGRIAAKLSRVRVLTLDSSTQREILLGVAPVEEDGSFYIAVPPDQPMRFELLDSAGRVVRAQRSWIWSRSGEEHGCVGCHEDRALAPENRWPLALRRLAGPAPLGVK